MQVAQRMTAAQYLAMDLEEQRTELVDGLIVVNEPRLPHALLTTRLLFELMTWSRSAPGRGLVVVPIDVQLDDRNVYAPDLLWYAQERMPAPDAPWPYPLPDLAIEIRSPSTWRYDVGTKRRTYERAGLAELWLVDGEAGVVRTFRRSDLEVATFDLVRELGCDETLRSPLLPGFGLPVAHLLVTG